ncbi:MAG: hypothetical protein HPY44_17295 [Armatimonadetes bacterium]|nr:hypothetical protein [Armatimonadota bacterium]
MRPLHAFVIGWSAAAIALPALLPAAEVSTLMPPPKQLRVGAGMVRVSGISRAEVAQDEAMVNYAVEVLGKSLGETTTGETGSTPLRVVITDAAGLKDAADALGLAAPPDERAAEAFVLDVGISRGDTATLTASPAGAVYAAYAIQQLVREEGGKQVLPRVAISDWPTLTERAHTGCPRNTSPGALRTLDWFARWRINAAYYEIYGDQGQDTVPPEVSAVHEECARRGITLYGLISNWRTELLLKRQLCPSNPEDLARIRRYSTELLDRGCDGLIFLFDDITRDAATHTERCAGCREKFGSLAAVQLALLEPMLDVARQRGVTRLMVCPTPYFQGWQTYYGGLDGPGYFRVWGEAPQMADVAQYFCQLRRDEIEAVREAGLRNFVYWYNGLYDQDQFVPEMARQPGLWGGFSQLPWGWYLERWDPEKGVVPREDSIAALRELPTLTDRAWLCGGGDWNFALWGSYCWDPANYDVERYERNMLEAIFGQTAASQYSAWRDAVRSCVPLLASRVKVITSEARGRLIQALSDAAVRSDTAAREFEATVTAPRAPGVADGRMRQDTARRMSESARALRGLVDSAGAPVTAVTMGPERENAVGEATRRERTYYVSDFWSRFALRYSQTQEPDGSVHRSQWHFGSGLGMTGPSYRNWYDAGFIDVVLDGQSLDTCTPAFTTLDTAGGQVLQGVWRTAKGTVTLRFGLLEGGLSIRGVIEGAGEIAPRVDLFAIPSAGNGDWADMAKFAVYETGEVDSGKPLDLPQGADWILLGDRNYDVPREKAEGPCAVLFGQPAPAVHHDGGTYVVKVTGSYPAGTSEFSLLVWDFNGLSNAQALAELRRKLPSARAGLSAAR